MGMGNSWPRVPIKDIYLGLYDGPHATPKASRAGPIFLGIRNITEDGRLDLSEVRRISDAEYPLWTKRVTPQCGDIVFTYEATLNRYAVIPEGFRGCLGRRTALIRPDPERIDTRFLFYSFFSPEWRGTIARNLLVGSTVDRIPLTSFPTFRIALPPLGMQRRIADVLSTYDNLIENNTRRIAVLEEMAQALYREWFLNFRFPGHEDVEMVESELGSVPAGWEIETLGELADEVRRSVDPRTVDPATGYVGLEHLPRRSIALSDWGRAADVQSTKLSFKKGDILFGKIRPYFHKVVVAPLDGICSSDAIVIVPRAEDYAALTLACVSSDAFVAHATQTAQGTKMPRANWNVLIEYPVVTPSTELLHQFNEIVDSLLGQIHNLIFQNRTLRRTRDLLLPKLISGEIEVPEAEDALALAAS